MSEIQGVRIIPKRKIFDDRGAIFHMLRNDDPEYSKFGEIYFSKIYPGAVKAWHHHSQMTLNYYLISGAIRLALFDDRLGSPSRGKTQEIYLEESIGQLIVVPPGIWNGFKGLGAVPSLVANCATEPHAADEITRKPFDDAFFKYNWSQRNG